MHMSPKKKKGDNLLEMSNLIFWEKYQFSNCLICPGSVKGQGIFFHASAFV